MPELPEAEAGRALIERTCVGKEITRVWTREEGGGARDGEFDPIVISAPEKEFCEHVTGNTVVAAHRRGKYVWLELAQPPHIVFHFGMTGTFAVKGVAAHMYQRFAVDSTSWPPRYSKCRFLFADGTEVVYINSRRLGRVSLSPSPTAAGPISLLGKDPILDAGSITSAWFASEVGRRSTAIKTVLLDQRILAGVGNWVADEILYAARVHPARRACALSPSELDAVRVATLQIPQEACAVGADSTRFPPHWIFHKRWNKPRKRARRKDAAAEGDSLRDAEGRPISFVTVGGRTSAVVLPLQRPSPPRKEADSPDPIPEPEPVAATDGSCASSARSPREGRRRERQLRGGDGGRTLAE